MSFTVGQKVWILRPKRQDKLSSWWTGPHQIIKQVGDSTWEIDVGNKHRVVHDAQMKPWEPALTGKNWPLHHRMLTEHDNEDSTPDEWIVDRIIKHRRRPDGQLEFLVRWQGFTSDDDTWERAHHFLPRVNVDWLAYCQKHKLDLPLQHIIEH